MNRKIFVQCATGGCATLGDQANQEIGLHHATPLGSEIVRLLGKTGRGRRMVNVTRLTHCMVRPCGTMSFVKLAFAVLHQCIRSLIGAVLLRTIMDISARAVSLS